MVQPLLVEAGNCPIPSLLIAKKCSHVFEQYIFIIKYIFKSLELVRFFMYLKNGSFAHQAGIYLAENTEKR